MYQGSPTASGAGLRPGHRGVCAPARVGVRGVRGAMPGTTGCARCRTSMNLAHTPTSRAGTRSRCRRATRSRQTRPAPRRERAADLLERDDAAQAVVAVDDHERAERAQGLGGQSCSIGVSSWTRKASSPSGSSTSATVSAGLPVLDGAVDRLLVQEPEEAAEVVDDREPRPAVAQEELVLGLQDGGVARHRDRLGVHDVGDGHALQALGEAARDDRAGRGLAEEPAQAGSTRSR